jgi:hypothetical protein
MAEPVIESLRPVPESGIWNILIDFYREHGLEAWRSGTVPQRVTSNGYLADVYASVTAAFLRDCAGGAPGPTPLILEVGGGSGLFSWLFLKRLAHHCPPGRGAPRAFDYLLTDAVARNVASWLALPRLRRLVDDGSLNVGVLKIGPELRVEPVAPSRRGEFDLAAQPVVLIANYVLDSVPCELLRIRNGAVLQEMIALERPEPGPGVGGRSVAPRFESRAMSPPYTAHEGVNRVIEEYRAVVPDGCVPVPLDVIAFLEHFLRSSHPFLMLAGDVAYTRAAFQPEPPLIFREYVACTANFHLIGRIFEQWSGTPVFSRYADHRFSVAAFLQPAGPVDLTATRQAARATLYDFTPHDAYNVERALRDGEAELDFREVEAWLRFARFDAYAASLCIPHLIGIVERDEWFDRETMRDMLLEAYAAEFPEVSGVETLATQLGFFFMKARMYQDAADLLAHSTPEPARDAEHRYLLAIALNRLGRVAEAAHALDEILAVTPAYWQAMPGVGGTASEIVDAVLAEADDAPHLNYIVLKLSVQAFAHLAASREPV